jgi:hypothetical protein
MTDSASIPLMKINYLLYLNMKFMFHQMPGLHIMFSVGYAVFTAVIMKSMVFCVVWPWEKPNVSKEYTASVSRVDL